MNILLIDDDQIILDSLDIILSEQDNINVIGKFTNALVAIDYIRNHDVDLILMDIQMPYLNGIEATKKILEMTPSIKIIMLTTFHDYKNIHQSLKAGAKGYMLKTDEEKKQIAMIFSVHEGLTVLSEEALDSYTQNISFHLLTDRENEVVSCVAEGMSNKEIALFLHLSEGRVRNMLSIILEKLQIRDRTQLAIHYWQDKSV